jgi:FixJ family two-component response regulator
LKMPGGNGNSLLEKCRAKLAKPPFFIFVTGWAEVEMKEMLIHKGIDIFPKPYDRKELMACVMKKLGLNP